MGQYIQQQEQEDEALSLRDFPLNAGDDQPESDHNGRSSSSSEFFEFLTAQNYQMSLAEDIIFCGKLVPFKDLSLPPPIKTSDQTQQRRLSSFRRRSESLSALQSSAVSRSNSINNSKLMMRNSRSLDYRRLQRFSSSSENSMDRNSSARRSETAASKRTAKPRWYFFMFGVVKPPTEMELSDIKNRQFRRSSSAMAFPPPCAADNSKKPPVSKCSSHRLLKVLSCRDNTSVAVTASFCMPPPALQSI